MKICFTTRTYDNIRQYQNLGVLFPNSKELAETNLTQLGTLATDGLILSTIDADYIGMHETFQCLYGYNAVSVSITKQAIGAE